MSGKVWGAVGERCLSDGMSGDSDRTHTHHCGRPIHPTLNRQAWDRLSGLVRADVTHGIAGVRTRLGIAQSDHGKSDGGAGAVAAAADEGTGDDPEQDDEVAR